MIASVVLATAVVGIVGPLCASQQQATTTRQTATALALGEQLMEEIASRPYADPDDGSMTLGPPGNEQGRANYDDIFDYHKYHDTTTALKNMAGQTVSGLGTEVFARDVTVEYRSGPSTTSATPGDFALVTVTVTLPTSQTVKLSRLFTQIQIDR